VKCGDLSTPPLLLRQTLRERSTPLLKRCDKTGETPRSHFSLLGGEFCPPLFTPYPTPDNSAKRCGINKEMSDRLCDSDFSKLISACLLRLRQKTPFFGTLAMFARFVESETIPTAATDGCDIFVNPQFLGALPSQQQDGAILHELLHAALLHPQRMRSRDPQLWNVAADIVVNGTILRQPGCELPPGGLRDEQLEHLSVEEVYELLQLPGGNKFELVERDLLATPATTPASQSERSLRAHWQQALQQATAIASGTAAGGKVSECIDRELGVIFDSQLDWRAYLWRYIVQTPTDFQGFDRRFVWRGLYLEGLQHESVSIYIAIDTSSSIRSSQLQLFIGEVRAILATYPQVECQLFYVDEAIHATHVLTADATLPIPEGGGGTSFVPFFDRIAEIWDGYTQTVCIYLTDGYGEFPPHAPVLPTLWVVPPGGLDLALFPFGEAVRLLAVNSD
jgi:predicted metal-dependent peptidase